MGMGGVGGRITPCPVRSTGTGLQTVGGLAVWGVGVRAWAYEASRDGDGKVSEVSVEADPGVGALVHQRQLEVELLPHHRLRKALDPVCVAGPGAK